MTTWEMTLGQVEENRDRNGEQLLQDAMESDNIDPT